MRHPYRIREIAQQSGFSEATVDRVLHGRPGVRASTAAEVGQAVRDLDRQREQVRLAGRTVLVDLVMTAPQRFSITARTALEAELSTARPAAVRARFHLREDADVGAAIVALAGIRRRGSHGVVLKAPDHPDIAAAVAELADVGIPTVTAFTDLPTSRRVAYVGIDNHSAGATAAYLLTRMRARPTGMVLIALSRSSYRGEGEREAGFRTAIAELAPATALIEVTDTDGLENATFAAVSAAVTGRRAVDAVYSIGGGNGAILDALAAAGQEPSVFIAHDLDPDNVGMLRTGRLTAVLHHDLRADMRRALHLLLQARGLRPGRPETRASQVQVVTPYNQP